MVSNVNAYFTKSIHVIIYLPSRNLFILSQDKKKTNYM